MIRPTSLIDPMIRLRPPVTGRRLAREQVGARHRRLDAVVHEASGTRGRSPRHQQLPLVFVDSPVTSNIAAGSRQVTAASRLTIRARRSLLARLMARQATLKLDVVDKFSTALSRARSVVQP